MLCIATACSSLAWADNVNIGSGTSIDAWADGATNSTNYYTANSSGTAILTINVATEDPHVPEQVEFYTNIYSGVISDGSSGGKVGLTITVGEFVSYLTANYVFQITQPQTYTGPTTINFVDTSSSAFIQLSGNGTLGTGDITLGEHGVLEFAGSGYKDFTQNINTQGKITLSTDSSMTISGNITVDTLLCGNDYYITTNAKHTLSGNNNVSVLNVDAGNTVIISGNTTATGVILRTGKIVVSDAGSLSGTVQGQNYGQYDVSKLEFNGTSEFSSNVISSSVIYSGKDAMTISGAISANSSLSVTGSGTLTVSATNSYTGGTTISNGKLILTGDGTLGSGAVAIDTNGTLEVNVASGNEKTLANTISGVKASETVTNYGTVKKTGEGTLKLNTETGGSISVESFIQTAGELDIKGALTGDLDLEGGTFSPGNSIGDVTVSDTTSISKTATMLFEIASDSSYDTLTTKDLTVDKTGFLNLAISGSFEETTKFAIITYDKLDGTAASNVASWLGSITGADDPSKWSLTSSGNTIYAKFTGKDPEPTGAGVPEPSTWALLILGFAGLMWYRRKK